MGPIGAHLALPGLLAEADALAAKFTQLIALSQVELARQSHGLHYQNSKSLRKQFGFARETAHQIIKQSTVCPQYLAYLIRPSS